MLSFGLANFGMSKIYQGNLQSKCRNECRLAQLFLDTLEVTVQKKSEIVGEIYLQLWKCNLVNFSEILANTCANTNLH